MNGEISINGKPQYYLADLAGNPVQPSAELQAALIVLLIKENLTNQAFLKNVEELGFQILNKPLATWKQNDPTTEPERPSPPSKSAAKTKPKTRQRKVTKKG